MSGYSSVRESVSRYWLILTSGVILLSLAGLAGCGSMRLNSRWLDRHVTIDGSADDWEGLLVPVDDGAAYVGVMNDSSSVYICVMTARADLQRRLSRLGLLVSFQPEDHDKPPLGICYPVHPFGPDRTPRAIQTNGDVPQDRLPEDRAFASDQGIAEIVGKNNQDRIRISSDSMPGIEVKTGGGKQWFVYELKVPMALQSRYPYAIEAKAGQNVTVRMQAEKPEMSRMNSARARGDWGGGSGGGEHGRGGWGGGHPGGGMGRGDRGERGAPGQTPVEFDVSAKVRLAPTPPV